MNSHNESAEEILDRCRTFTEEHGGEQRTGRGTSQVGPTVPWTEAIKIHKENERLQVEERIQRRAIPGDNVDRYTPRVRNGSIGHPGKTLRSQGLE